MSSQSRGTRVCMPTWRAFNRQLFNSSLYEAQDVLCEMENVDLMCLEPHRSFHLRERWITQLLYHDPTGKVAFVNPGLGRRRVKDKYDVFLVVCQSHNDLLYINAVDGWRERSDVSICWLDEVWAGTAKHYRPWFQILKRFNFIFACSKSGANVLSEIIGRKCYWMPGGVDAVRFSPFPNPPKRVVDVYSIGRRWEGIHRSLLQLSADRSTFYIYDSVADLANKSSLNDQEHRDLYANLAKRSRYFLVAPAKMDAVAHSHGVSECGFRYFEGSAAGAIMIGQVPTCDEYTELFGWTDAVIPVRQDGSDVVDVLSSLNSDPDRAAELSRRNAVEAMSRHDWLYRWKEIWRTAGIPLSPKMTMRERYLEKLASLSISEANSDEWCRR